MKTISMNGLVHFGVLKADFNGPAVAKLAYTQGSFAMLSDEHRDGYLMGFMNSAMDHNPGLAIYDCWDELNDSTMISILPLLTVVVF